MASQRGHPRLWTSTVEAIILIALAKALADRYPTAGQLAATA